jgi:hypothetical protein
MAIVEKLKPDQYSDTSCSSSSFIINSVKRTSSETVRMAEAYKGHRISTTSPSPFCVESIHSHHQHLWAHTDEAPPPLNMGLQYIMSIQNKDISLAEGNAIRLPFRLEPEATAQIEKESPGEKLERQRMHMEDMLSMTREKEEASRRADALEKRLQDEKARYLAWARGKQAIFRDYEAMHVIKPKKVVWTCTNCGTTNQRFVYVCEWCNESSRVQGTNEKTMNIFIVTIVPVWRGILYWYLYE